VEFVPETVRLAPLLVGAFVAAAFLTFVLTPIARSIAVRRGFVDRPGGRRVNTRPIPRAGGVAFAAAFLAVAIGVLVIDEAVPSIRLSGAVDQGELFALLAGAAVATVLGLLDDVFQLRARWQLVGQIALALGAVWLGIQVVTLNDPFGPGRLTLIPPVAIGFSVFWIVGMINSINFIDGLDGLSSGIGLIAALTLGLISLTNAGGPFGQPLVAAMCFTLAGALFGFLRWNFHPASVFAGTAGTMFIGYSLAVLSVLGTAKVAIALLVLGVPIIDAFWIIVRRVANRKLPFSPDRGHIHHRLLDLGLSHMQTVLLIYVICAGLALLSFVLSGSGQLYAFMGLVIVFGLGLFALARSETGDALEADAYDDERPAFRAPGR
jgi:UDP-GlcNAc:undecaprenyl-phosphate/decaprenyl-phosphate GlcNAc-1-phosphate transferase